MYDVRVAISHSKCVEIGVKGIEISLRCGKVYSKTVLLIIETSRDKLFHIRSSQTNFKYEQ